MSVPTVSDGEYYFYRKVDDDDTTGPSGTALIVTIGGALYARIPHDRGDNSHVIPITQVMFTQQGGTVWKGPTSLANCDNYGTTYTDTDVDALATLALPNLDLAGVAEGDAPTWTDDHLFSGAGKRLTLGSTFFNLNLGGVVSIGTGSASLDGPGSRLSAETGTADDLDTLIYGLGAPLVGDLVIVSADTGDTITLKDGTGNLDLGADVIITDTQIALLLFNGTNWVIPESAGGGGGGVTSFKTRTGAVIPLAADYTAVQVTATAAAGQDFIIPGMSLIHPGPVPPAGYGLDGPMQAAYPPPGTQIWILKA